MSKNKIKVRFHLAHGANYQRWQVRNGDDVEYYDPEDVMLEMRNAVLRNQRGTAERIHQGENKRVCAWVECEQITVKPVDSMVMPHVNDFAHYNPKRRPYWHDTARRNIDNTKYERLATYGRLIVMPK